MSNFCFKQNAACLLRGLPIGLDCMEVTAGIVMWLPPCMIPSPAGGGLYSPPAHIREDPNCIVRILALKKHPRLLNVDNSRLCIVTAEIKAHTFTTLLGSQVGSSGSSFSSHESACSGGFCNQLLSVKAALPGSWLPLHTVTERTRARARDRRSMVNIRA